jgi:hypothetical protein
MHDSGGSIIFLRVFVGYVGIVSCIKACIKDVLPTFSKK